MLPAARGALFDQGVSTSWGGARDTGTASIKLMHYQGALEGRGHGAIALNGRNATESVLADAVVLTSGT